jgi:hypothetical protein
VFQSPGWTIPTLQTSAMLAEVDVLAAALFDTAWHLPREALACGDGRGFLADGKLIALSTAIALPPAHALAPETGAAVRAAQEALERKAARAEAAKDPTAPTLRAVSLALGACHKPYVEGALTTAKLEHDSKQASH